jgi:hypothetical protein
MSRDWIKAPLALKYVSAEELDQAAIRRIYQRAHSGLIATKAELLIEGELQRRDCLLNKNFWLKEHVEASEQDWKVGDFSNWTDEKVRVQAFGVSFDFVALSELIPSTQRAAALRRISTMNNEAWISAADLFKKLTEVSDAHRAQDAILEACQLGQIAGRALLAQGKFRDHPKRDWAAREWEIPIWFWRDFVTWNLHQNWQLNKSQGKGQLDGRYLDILLQGVHFHRSGLSSFGFPADDIVANGKSRAVPGRRSSYDWPAVSLAVFGQIYRGELKPETQADIECVLIEHLTKGDAEPSESTVRPFAKLIWEEFKKA